MTTVALIIALGLGALLLLLILLTGVSRWRMRERHRPPVPELGSAPDSAARDAAHRADLDPAPPLRSPQHAIWRPPDRRVLLQRQQEAGQRQVDPNDPSRRLSEARRRGSAREHAAWYSGADSEPARMPSAPSDFPAEAGFTEPRVTPPEPETAPTSRLGRKRQGLDSLITEWPPDPKEPPRER